MTRNPPELRKEHTKYTPAEMADWDARSTDSSCSSQDIEPIYTPSHSSWPTDEDESINSEADSYDEIADPFLDYYAIEEPPTKDDELNNAAQPDPYLRRIIIAMLCLLLTLGCVYMKEMIVNRVQYNVENLHYRDTAVPQLECPEHERDAGLNLAREVLQQAEQRFQQAAQELWEAGLALNSAATAGAAATTVRTVATATTATTTTNATTVTTATSATSPHPESESEPADPETASVRSTTARLLREFVNERSIVKERTEKKAAALKEAVAAVEESAEKIGSEDSTEDAVSDAKSPQESKAFPASPTILKIAKWTKCPQHAGCCIGDIWTNTGKCLEYVQRPDHGAKKPKMRFWDGLV
ncbi:uncharacterized protein BDZ99DRAFT_498037 [Mytilinidion resinicola]|uniref:Uncharacterized protein n=1 Tax=Mytilinidion resinicola TaxID=574789 RepID=A0A6A6YQV8_9PEZI|nr:uncharacterized protein BDZ99DRAFT_498037 [Mytilinidion resinicola]KAF2811170.1 hypothetical protein BDZ99DRAFT_498037 [Mytilinidion resinicola]